MSKYTAESPYQYKLRQACRSDFQQGVDHSGGHYKTWQRFVDSSNQDGSPPNLPQQRPLRQHCARLLPGAPLQHPARLRQQQPRHRLLPGTQLHRGAALPGHQGRGRQLLAAEGYLRDHLAGILHRIHARLGDRALCYELCHGVLTSAFQAF